MSQKVKNLFHDLNKRRDQMNTCYECILHDYRQGEQPLSEDIKELEELLEAFSKLAKNLSKEIGQGVLNEIRK